MRSRPRSTWPVRVAAVLLVGLVMGLGVLPEGPAVAHAELESSAPPAVLDDRVTALLDPLTEPGRYQVVYDVVAADGHLVEGAYTFRLAATAATRPAAEPGPLSTRVAPPAAGGPDAVASTTVDTQDTNARAGGASRLLRSGGLLTRLVLDGAMAVVLGALVTVAFLLPDAGTVSGAGRRLIVTARRGAWVWGTAALASAVLSVSELGLPLGRLASDPVLLALVLETPRGRALGLIALACLALALCLGAVRTRLGGQVALLVAVVATLPLLSSGHAGGAGHLLVAEGRVLHVLAVSAWVGGLIAMLLLAGHRSDLVHALPRFSVLALVCYLVAGLGGTAAAVGELGVEPTRWASTYGVLLLAKVMALAGLGVVGWLHRRRTVPAVAAGSRTGFVRLAAVELLVMAAAGALGVVVSTTAPPAGSAGTGAGSHDGVVQLGPVGLTVALLALAAYAAGAVAARARGLRWRPRRSVSWVAAVTLAVVLAGTVHEPVSPSVWAAVLAAGALVLPLLVIAARPLDLLRVAHDRPGLVRGLPGALAEPGNAVAVVLVGLVVLARVGPADRSQSSPWVGALVLVVAVVVGLVGLAPLLGEPRARRRSPGAPAEPSAYRASRS